MNNVIPLPRLEIRHGLSDDRESVTTLVEAVWREVYSGHLPPGAPDGPEYFTRLAGDPGDHGWLAKLGDQVVGYCRVEANCVDQIWVPRRMRRRSIGSALLARALQSIRARGFAFAQAGCEDFNQPARAFLEAKGWRVIGSQPQSLGAGRSCTALVFSLPLR
jgi:GNAT superfamily N-acetyltransferase